MPSDPPDDLRTARAALLGRGDLTGASLRAALTSLADAWLSAALDAATGGDLGGLALVAVGGYGRRQPAPGSDLDLVLVHAGRGDVAEVAERLWYPIWDSGVALDHSVRTVAEAVAVAREDLKAALGLLDGRHVAGDPALSADLLERARGSWRSTAGVRVPLLLAASRERAERAGEAAFLLEPDLKECRGGLRDVTALRALAAAWVVDAPGPRVRAAEERLLDVRGELHRRTGRGADKLLLQEQDALAEVLGLADADALLRTVSEAARSIAWAWDESARRAERWLPAPRRWLPARRYRPESEREPLADGVVAQGGEVVLARDAEPDADPALLLRVAAAAAERRLPISPRALDRLSIEAAAVPEPWPAAVRNAFVALLGAGAGTVAVIEALDQAGLFARLLPEWDRVRSKPQRNAVHRFTVDRHLVEAAVEASALSRRVARPDLLLVGALLHDIGKGWPGDHTEAGVAAVGDIAPRLGFRPEDVATLVRLVRCHLLLPETATRRDLDDPATVVTVAEAVGGSRQVLELLHALTEADARATGPAAWSGWKERLVAELVRRTASALAGEEPPAETPLTAEQQELARRGELGLAARSLPDAAELEVTVVGPDRPGFLWRAAGVLALHRLGVHAAAVTSLGSTAVEVFTVSPRFGTAPDWRSVRDDLRAAMEGSLPLAERLAARERAYARRDHAPAPPRVLVLDDASAAATVVEVRAHDTAGVLARIARALDSCGLDVRSARVSTLGAEVVDAFYVVDAEGRKLPPAMADRIERAVLAALSG